jgi:hypothetical protein
VSAPAGPVTRRRMPPPIEQAPEVVRAACVGPCVDCARPLGRRRVLDADPVLLAWLIRAGSISPPRCVTCYAHHIGEPTTRVARRESRGVARRLRNTLSVVAARRMVGACVGCGHTPDVGPHRRDCPELAGRS